MKKQLITTKDGSKTIHFPEWNESYHSQHGAIKEALHVYIQSGLEFRIKDAFPPHLSILEMGFGTGLNAYLSYKFSKTYNLDLRYTGIEKYPIQEEMLKQLNYVPPEDQGFFNALHHSTWEQFNQISSLFKLKKLNLDLDVFQTQDKYDVIYFDAFGPRVQPHLWHKTILQNMYDILNPHGVWVTYCCKGSVRRDLLEIGFQVEKITGPPGKREMLRAIKIL